jgi:hypothetical protein
MCKYVNVDVFIMNDYEDMNASYGNWERNRERRSISSKFVSKPSLASYPVVCIIVSDIYNFSF